jgi:hypothetical protein
MNKGDTVLEIMRLNRSADAEFLCEFSEEQLTGYLDRLNAASAGRSLPETAKFPMPNRPVVAGAA